MRKIVDVRKSKGYTQEFVAARVGVAVSSYNQYETGSRNIPTDIAEKIAAALGVKTDEIFLPVKFAIREKAEKTSQNANARR